MNHRKYCRVSATLFTVVALAHLTRLLNGWTFEIETVVIPMYVSVLGLLGPGALAFWGFREANRSHE